MASAELDEETRRLIKLFRPAKDAETSWRIDVSAELAWYLDMLQQNDAAAAENVDDSAQLNQGLASVIAYEGINFSQASAVVMEATRVFSRKVDFLRKQMDSTLNTILTGAAAGQSKKAKQRRQRAATLGAVNLPEWELPDIPDSVEFMHLPLEKLTGFRVYTEDNGKHILPLEKRLHILAPTELIKQSPHSSPVREIQTLQSDDEVMVDDAPKASRRQSLLGPDVITTSATEGDPGAKTFPICHNIREIAILKKQVFSRPTVHLLAPSQINPSLAGNSFHFELFNFFKTHATTRAIMGYSGLLSFLTYRPLFDAQQSNHSTVRVSFSPRIGGGDCGGESVHPGASVMQSQAMSANFGASAAAPSARPVAPQVPTSKHTARSGNQEPDFHDEHEALGKDAPIRIGPTTQKINVQLYNQSLDDICAKLNAIKADKEVNFLDNLCIALTGEYGIERLKFTPGMKHQSTFPFFTDIKRPNPSGGSYHYDWNLPPRERSAPAKTPTVGANADVYEDVGGFEDDINDYMGDELDEARMMEPAASVMHGSESVMLVDTFSRLDNRLSIIDHNQSHMRASVHGSVNILSQMHERIGIWRQRVEQWMTVAANEESFDIPTYVQRIRLVKEEHNKAIEQEQQSGEGGEALQPNAVSFREVCKGAKRHEVCRLFLTSLLLVNRYGLDIQQKNVNDFSINLDQLADEDPEL